VRSSSRARICWERIGIQFIEDRTEWGRREVPGAEWRSYGLREEAGFSTIHEFRTIYGHRRALSRRRGRRRDR
jgi:hypothetical protein